MYFNDAMEIQATQQELTLDVLKTQRFILYIYPKDNTSGCTLEAMEFAELYDAFKGEGFEVYGLSKDTLKSHARFIEKHSLPFDLISDPSREILEAFQTVVEKKMYGKPVKGTERSTFVFTEGLTLNKEFRAVKPAGHAQAVLAYVRTIK